MKKRIISAVAALSAVSLLSAAVGAAPAATPTYNDTLEKEYTLVDDASTEQKTYHNVTENGVTYHNAMVMKKVLQIDDTSNIP